MNGIKPLDHLDDKAIVKILKDEYMRKRFLNDFAYMLFNGNIHIEGHKGDIHGTFHEWLFSLMFPQLKKQVSFGTGINGYKEYRCKCYVAENVEISAKNRVYNLRCYVIL